MLTRKKINTTLDRVHDYVLSDISSNSIRNAARRVIRKKTKFLKVDHQSAFEKLSEKKIEYFEIIEGHWAETDCTKIWLNRCKPFDAETLFTTILHEVLHGIVLKNILHRVPKYKFRYIFYMSQIGNIHIHHGKSIGIVQLS